MWLVGADNVTVKQNTIRINNFVGIATVSTLVLGSLAGILSLIIGIAIAERWLVIGSAGLLLLPFLQLLRAPGSRTITFRLRPKMPC